LGVVQLLDEMSLEEGAPPPRKAAKAAPPRKQTQSRKVRKEASKQAKATPPRKQTQSRKVRKEARKQAKATPPRKKRRQSRKARKAADDAHWKRKAAAETAAYISGAASRKSAPRAWEYEKAHDHVPKARRDKRFKKFTRTTYAAEKARKSAGRKRRQERSLKRSKRREKDHKRRARDRARQAKKRLHRAQDRRAREKIRGVFKKPEFKRRMVKRTLRTRKRLIQKTAASEKSHKSRDKARLASKTAREKVKKRRTVANEKRTKAKNVAKEKKEKADAAKLERKAKEAEKKSKQEKVKKEKDSKSAKEKKAKMAEKSTKEHKAKAAKNAEKAQKKRQADAAIALARHNMLNKCSRAYTIENCRKLATIANLTLGGDGMTFAGDFRTKGCFTLQKGKGKRVAHYGTGGSTVAKVAPTRRSGEARLAGHDKDHNCQKEDAAKQSATTRALAGEYSVFYRGRQRDSRNNMVIGCDGKAGQKGVFSDRLHFTGVKAKCPRDGSATMFILKTHGGNKFECLHSAGTSIKGGHYLSQNNLWGTIEYRLKKRTNCPKPRVAASKPKPTQTKRAPKRAPARRP